MSPVIILFPNRLFCCEISKSKIFFLRMFFISLAGKIQSQNDLICPYEVAIHDFVVDITLL